MMTERIYRITDEDLELILESLEASQGLAERTNYRRSEVVVADQLGDLRASLANQKITNITGE